MAAADKLKKGFTIIDFKLLVKADWNYKKEDKEKAVALKNNIKRSGQVENIIVREVKGGRLEVVNGNHRYDVFKELKFTQVYVFNMGKVSQPAAERLAVETNETRFETDMVRFAEVIKRISLEYPLDELANTLPLTKIEMSELIQSIDFDWKAYKNQTEKANEKRTKVQETEITCPNCGEKIYL